MHDAPHARSFREPGAGLSSSVIPSMRAGDVFVSLPKRVSMARLLAFSGGALDSPSFPDRNLHTDQQLAEAAGHVAPISSGSHAEGLLLQLLVEVVGPRWFASGSLSVSFRGPVFEGDDLTSHALVADVQTTADGWTCKMDIWCENQRGDRPLVGSASVTDSNSVNLVQ